MHTYGNVVLLALLLGCEMSLPYSLVACLGQEDTFSLQVLQQLNTARLCPACVSVPPPPSVQLAVFIRGLSALEERLLRAAAAAREAGI